MTLLDMATKSTFSYLERNELFLLLLLTLEFKNWATGMVYFGIELNAIVFLFWV
jgi:hypothetical protein